MNTLSYKGYEARVGYDEGADAFCGEIVNLPERIAFSGHSVAELKQAFAAAVDAYVAACAARGEAPGAPYSGEFVVKVDPALHRAVARAANLSGVGFQRFVAAALESAASYWPDS